MAQWVKKQPAEDFGFTPWSGRSPGGGLGNPPQYSCLENPMDREASQATVNGVTKSQTGLKQLSTRTCMQGTKIPHSSWCGQKKQKKSVKYSKKKKGKEGGR